MEEVVIVGGGPVGLWTALQIQKRQPKWSIHIYERYEEYKRSHVLRLDHWSMLLYGRNNKDEQENIFFNEVTGKSLNNVLMQPANSLFIRTNDFEAALKKYAITKGINLHIQTITSPEHIMEQHPDCKQFIAADGAHSKMRNQLLGEDSIKEKPLQYIVEIKYQVKGKAQKGNVLKTNKILNNMAFEYVGKEKNGMSPVTLRFFLKKSDYENLPNASFKEPLSIDSPILPTSLKKDIEAYLSMRSNKYGEEYCKDSGKLTKLILSLYVAKKFTVKKDKKAWFLVGDAAMGVPYFRALNSGMILGSRLSQILCSDNWPINNDLDKKVFFYNLHQPMHVKTEFLIAESKNFALDCYDSIRKLISFSDDDIENYLNTNIDSLAFSCNYEDNSLEKENTIKKKNSD